MDHKAGIALPRTVDYSRRPMLVFWEVTRACLLACRHCRASAARDPLPGELSSDEGRALIDQVAAFGRPYPILVLTGGDCLLRSDVFEMVAYADSLGVPVAMSPSVTPMLTPRRSAGWSRRGEGRLAQPRRRDAGHARRRPRHPRALRPRPSRRSARLVDAGLKVQINTTVMRANLDELPDIAALMAETGVAIWEVFFLVHVGRGEATGAITPAEHEDVCHFLYDASHYGFTVRTVEAPFFRRVVVQRRAGEPAPGTRRTSRCATVSWTGSVPPSAGRPPTRCPPATEGHRLRQPRRRGVPGRLPAVAFGLRPGAAARGDLPRQPGAAQHQGSGVRWPLRAM